jgi:hypothetical protein
MELKGEMVSRGNFSLVAVAVSVAVAMAVAGTVASVSGSE